MREKGPLACVFDVCGPSVCGLGGFLGVEGVRSGVGDRVRVYYSPALLLCPPSTDNKRPLP